MKAATISKTAMAPQADVTIRIKGCDVVLYALMMEELGLVLIDKEAKDLCRDVRGQVLARVSTEMRGRLRVSA